MRHTARNAMLSVSAAVLLVAASFVLFPFYRDNFSTHFPRRSALAESLLAGALPLWDPSVGGGQPLAGNPNLLAFYPDFWLQLVLPPIPAFTLHFLLHWVAGGVAMRALLRHYRIGRGWSSFGAVLWMVSGPCISLFSFYNLITAAALIPAALLTAERLADRPDWRRAAGFGAVFGLLALAGEPVTLLATAFASGLLVARRTSRRFLAPGLLAIFLAILIASPLLLAWSEVAGEMERGARSYSPETVLAASLSPWALAEVALGPVRGRITDPSSAGLSASGERSRWPPLLISTFLGALAIPAMAGASGRFRAHQVGAGLLLFGALGQFNPLMVFLVERVELLRFGRYPEKLAIPAGALLVVLIGGWLAEESRSAVARWTSIAFAVGIVVLAASALAGVSDWSGAMRLRILLFGALAVAVLVLAALPVDSRRTRALALLTMLPAALGAVFAMPIDTRSGWDRVPPPAEAFPGERIVRIARPEDLNRGPESIRYRYRAAALAADPVWGAPFGLRYALDRSPDGMYSLLSRIAQERFEGGGTEEKLRWAAMLGASAIVSDAVLESGKPSGVFTIGARRVAVYEVSRPLPPVLAVPEVLGVAYINDAVGGIEEPSFDPSLLAFGPPGTSAVGRIVVEETRGGAGEWDIDVSAPEGGTLLINESYFRAWRTTDQEGRALASFPLNVDRLGVSVPAGTTRVRAEFGRRRSSILAGWCVSLLILSAAIVVSFRSPSARD